MALCALNACIPSHLTVQQSESAVAVDAVSQLPLAQADVVVETWQVTTPTGMRSKIKYRFRTRTDESGRFSIPEVKEWFAVVPIPDLPPAFNHRLCVTASQHDPAIADPWATPDADPWSYRFTGRFELRPNTENATGGVCPF
jgi:hypothetical protein